MANTNHLDRLRKSAIGLLNEKNYTGAIAEAKRLLMAAKEENNDHYIVKSNYILGYTSKLTRDYGKAVLYYLEGARVAEMSDDLTIKQDLISMYKNLALIVADYKHYDLAHKFNQKALEIASAINDEKQVINILQNDGYAYVDDSKYDSAINVFNRVLTSYNPDLRKVVGLKNNLGLAYWNLRKTDEAIKQYRSILNLRDSIDDAEFIAKVIHNLGLVLMDKQEYEKALIYFKESEEMSISEGFTNGLFANYKYIGLSLHKMGRKSEALEYCLKAAALFDETYVDPEHFDIFKLIASFYFSNNQHELAFQYEKQHIKHLEAFIARQKEIEELDKKYNMELLTQRYFDLLAAEERHRQTVLHTQLGLGSGILLSLFILFYVLYRHHSRRMATIRELRIIEDTSDV